MRTLHIPVSTAACFAMLVGVSASSAADKSDASKTTPAPEAVQVAPPAQAQQPVQVVPPVQAQQPVQAVPPVQAQQPAQAPPPSVIIIQPPAQQPAEKPKAQGEEQAGTTRTTSAPYPTTERFADRIEENLPNRSMLGTGAGLMILSYAPAAVIGATSARREDRRLIIPVAGPWLDLANRDCRTERCGANENVNKAMIITSGAVQGAGALMALGSLLIPERKTVHERVAEKPGVQIAPMIGGITGISAVGRF